MLSAGMFRRNPVESTLASFRIHIVSGTAFVRHQLFPELRAEGHTPTEALGRLRSVLARLLDSVADSWHRGQVERALNETDAAIRALLLPHGSGLAWHRPLD